MVLQLKFRLRNFDMFVGCLHHLNYSSVGISILTSCAKVPGLCPAWGGRVVRWCWGRPKAALLFWFFGDFRCGALLFMVIHVIYKYKNK